MGIDFSPDQRAQLEEMLQTSFGFGPDSTTSVLEDGNISGEELLNHKDEFKKITATCSSSSMCLGLFDDDFFNTDIDNALIASAVTDSPDSDTNNSTKKLDSEEEVTQASRSIDRLIDDRSGKFNGLVDTILPPDLYPDQTVAPAAFEYFTTMRGFTEKESNNVLSVQPSDRKYIVRTTKNAKKPSTVLAVTIFKGDHLKTTFDFLIAHMDRFDDYTGLYASSEVVESGGHLPQPGELSGQFRLRNSTNLNLGFVANADTQQDWGLLDESFGENSGAFVATFNLVEGSQDSDGVFKLFCDHLKGSAIVRPVKLEDGQMAAVTELEFEFGLVMAPQWVIDMTLGTTVKGFIDDMASSYYCSQGELTGKICEK